MSRLSDRIRRFALEERVHPARMRSQTKVAICVGCIYRLLNQQGLNLTGHRHVITALKGPKFYQMAEVEFVERIGPEQSSTTVLVYKI